MAKKFYITTPLYYVNSAPHIGHAYTNVAADSLARYARQTLGRENVRFLTGTDEHGHKIQKAALEEGVGPEEFADTMVSRFKQLWEKLEISYDDFIRTTEDRHIRFVSAYLDALYQRNEIYPAEYEGFYCTPCETFWTDTQLNRGACPDCARPVEKISEQSFFFQMRKHQGWLIEHIRANPDFIKPEIRKNEVLSFLSLNQLNDLCISRPRERLSWGIPLPFAPEHVTYVWFDALLNYLSAVGQIGPDGSYISEWWPADLQLIGKDILRQHAVYWPIMLHALGIALPKTVFAHGWWMLGDTKMSKSRGNAVSPLDMADKYGVEVFRFFLLKDIAFGSDGNFSEEAIIRRFNSDLANDLGNLVYRSLSMAEKYFGGVVPESGSGADETAKKIQSKISALPEDIASCLCARSGYNLSLALGHIWELVNMANKYVEDSKPWVLSRENKQRQLKDFMFLIVEAIRASAVAIRPFMPQTAESILCQFSGGRIKKAAPLFPRIQ